MRTIELDIRSIHTVRALHVYLRYMLRLAPHYGCNLDALHDVLGEIDRPTRLIVREKGATGEVAALLPRLWRVLSDAAEENGCLCVERAE